MQMPDGLVAETDGFAVVEIADVLRDESLAAARDRDRILQIGAGGDDARPVGAEVDRVRNEAARAPQIGRRAVDNSSHRIVGPDDDRPPMGHDQVGDALKPPLGVLVGRDQRLAAGIGAGRHEREVGRLIAPRSEVGRAGKRVQHEPVQRRIGEHQPDVGKVRRNARREQTPAPREHDRARALGKQRALGRTELGKTLGAGQIRDHHRKGLGVARLFAGARSGPRLRRARRRGGESPRAP